MKTFLTILMTLISTGLMAGVFFLACDYALLKSRVEALEITNRILAADYLTWHSTDLQPPSVEP